MPRPLWIAKNPYCRRSKLSKEAFERIAYFYFLEITAGWSRSGCAQMLNAGAEGVIFSRQTISRHFDLIGDFLWEHMILATDPRYEDKRRLDGLLAVLYGKADDLAESLDLVEMFLKSVPLPVAAPKERRSIYQHPVFDLLRRRSKVTRGFAPEGFHREVARAVFVCACVEARGIKIVSDKDFFSYPRIKEIARLSWTVLLTVLEENPL
ncbi:MAG: hypothetical protein KDI61_02335 [Alphaproteobacteria bacterium]|nr:hypothetical protein [Alphaproteobacteria bacterium]